MSRQVTELRVPDQGVSMQDLAGRLAEHYALAHDPERPVERTLLDSFDWRLHAAGGFLEYVGDGQRHLLIWHDAHGTPGPRLLVVTVPRFSRDLPPGLLRERLAPLLEMRALLPRVRVRSRLRTLRVLDPEAKTLMRLELEEGHFVASDGVREGPLPAVLRLVPVRGHEAVFDRVFRALDERLLPADRGLLHLALEATGQIPGDYSPKLDYVLNPAQRADQAAKEIHLGLLRTLAANLDGARADLDSEFLHDLRVATRRTRSALGQIKGVFPQAEVERFKEGFAWLQQVTGPTRDMDVYLLALDGYKAGLPPQLTDDLEPLRGFLEAHRAEAQERMAEALGSTRCVGLLDDWRAFLTSSLADHPHAPNAARPLKAVADERIWRMYRRVLREGRAIRDDTPADELHELRKSCKKLRYLMEFFQSLYDDKGIKGLIKTLKVLLDNLGGLQDLQVQAGTLKRYAEQMVDEGSGEADTLLAMGALIGGLAERQHAARREFAQIFAGFDTRPHRVAFKTLFKSR